MNENEILQPKSLAEQLLYSTVRISGIAENNKEFVGTGCFFQIDAQPGYKIDCILTNKHVLEDADFLQFCFHEAELIDGIYNPKGDCFTIKVKNYKDFWIPHPDVNVDLGAFVFSGIRLQITDRLKKRVFIKSIKQSSIHNDSYLMKNTSVADEVLMIGYPDGLWDTHNNFPIIRKGIAASHPALDFKNESTGVVDVACFPGSSGSPIFIHYSGSYPDKSGNLCVGSKCIFLGILDSGPYITNENTIETKELPTKPGSVIRTTQMIHLGYYVKAKEILKLAELVKTEIPNWS